MNDESTMIERVARAIDAELERQHVEEYLSYYRPRDPGEDWNAVDGNIIVQLLARAAIAAMREPTEEMDNAGGCRNTLGYDPAPSAVWRAMVDVAMGEGGVDNLESYTPGDVLPDGRIKLNSLSPIFGGYAPYGRVYVTMDQAKSAEKYGWRILNAGELVLIERAAPQP